MGKRRRTFTPEFKFQVAMEYLTGQKRRIEVLREYQLSDSTLERWCRQLAERGTRVFAATDDSLLAQREQQIAELERMIGQLTMELAAAKKASSWPDTRS
jgi:transposase